MGIVRGFVFEEQEGEGGGDIIEHNTKEQRNDFRDNQVDGIAQCNDS
jgi:hypothetical protein